MHKRDVVIFDVVSLTAETSSLPLRDRLGSHHHPQGQLLLGQICVLSDAQYFLSKILCVHKLPPFENLTNHALYCQNITLLYKSKTTDLLLSTQLFMCIYDQTIESTLYELFIVINSNAAD